MPRVSVRNRLDPDVFLTDFATSFRDGDENPISEGGLWQSGLAITGAWSDMQVAGGWCYGTQSGPVSPPYDDSCAFWIPPSGRQWVDMEVEAQIGIATRSGWTGFHEHLLLLRGRLAANSNICIECLFPATAVKLELVQWKGPLGTNSGGASGNPDSLCVLAEQATWPGTEDGHWIKASIVGSRVRMWHKTASASSYGNPYIDFTVGTDTPLINSADPVLSSGYPGIGHWKNGNGNLSDHYFRSFRAKHLV